MSIRWSQQADHVGGKQVRLVNWQSANLKPRHHTPSVSLTLTLNPNPPLTTAPLGFPRAREAGPALASRKVAHCLAHSYGMES